ncbi:hypothetical protein AX27061_2708 [Achromobacter xylosoxidans NBRC 15126 = ATCC 27061]|nr:hypothetical protein AX27061_2708 [Achromobacter xylosoxidans NBRC 15126 = ATCC 27061]
MFRQCQSRVPSEQKSPRGLCPRAPWDFHATREHSATAPGRRNRGGAGGDPSPPAKTSLQVY